MIATAGKMTDFGSDYSSSSEGDEDYVPSGDDESCDDLEGLVDEDGVEELPDQKKKKQKTKHTGKDDASSRRRTKWTALEEDGSGDDTEPEDDRQDQLKEEMKEEAKKKREEDEKKKADDLWSSFMSDVKQKPKPKSSQTQNSQAKKPSLTSSDKAGGDNKISTTAAALSSQSNGNNPSDILKITKVFDFAGEEIQVTKEVKVTSKEAKDYLKQQEEKKKEDAASGSSIRSLIPASKPALPPGLKRPGGGLGGVLGQIGKKQKISVLEKSQLDWTKFKRSEGIEEELKIHNKGKDGFVEKQKFLQRADVREYEIERDIRLTQSKTNR